MTKVIEAILFNTAFKPPRCSGKPCQMEFLVQTRFAVED